MAVSIVLAELTGCGRMRGNRVGIRNERGIGGGRISVEGAEHGFSRGQASRRQRPLRFYSGFRSAVVAGTAKVDRGFAFAGI